MSAYSLDTLPDDILLHVAAYLSTADILSLRAVRSYSGLIYQLLSLTVALRHAVTWRNSQNSDTSGRMLRSELRVQVFRRIAQPWPNYRVVT